MLVLGNVVICWVAWVGYQVDAGFVLTQLNPQRLLVRRECAANCQLKGRIGSMVL